MATSGCGCTMCGIPHDNMPFWDSELVLSTQGYPENEGQRNSANSQTYVGGYSEPNIIPLMIPLKYGWKIRKA